jgi:uncharacterized protein (TIGR02145 family)
VNKYSFLTTILTVVFSVGFSQDHGSFKDPRDGRVYKTVKIGDQEWMAENLNTDRFRNGDLIPEAKTKEEWEAAGQNCMPAWCYYDNDPKNGEKYGKLYNWYAVNDTRGLAPKGWHIPYDNEWEFLINNLGGPNKAGKMLKSKFGWSLEPNRFVWKPDPKFGQRKEPDTRNANGTNISGFSGLPGGCRGGGGFIGVNWSGVWWSSDECIFPIPIARLSDALSSIYVFGLSENPDEVVHTSFYKNQLAYIRCLKD